MKNIILLAGYCGSGKDTVGKYLCDNYDYKRLAFADKLKDTVSKIYNIKRENLDNQEFKNDFKIKPLGETEKTIREILIDYSFKEKEKNIHIFVDKIILEFKKSNDTNFVITDFRFKHEYDRIKEKIQDYNIITIYINRIDNEKYNKYINDKSENDLKSFDFDYILDNDSSLLQLYKQIEIVL